MQFFPLPLYRQLFHKNFESVVTGNCLAAGKLVSEENISLCFFKISFQERKKCVSGPHRRHILVFVQTSPQSAFISALDSAARQNPTWKTRTMAKQTERSAVKCTVETTIAPLHKKTHIQQYDKRCAFHSTEMECTASQTALSGRIEHTVTKARGM